MEKRMVTMKKMSRQECGRKRWAGVSKEKRSAEMRERANQLWDKIRAGGYKIQHESKDL